MSGRGGERSEGMSGGAKVFCASLFLGAVCAGVGLSYGFFWDFKYNADGTRSGIEFLDSSERAQANGNENPFVPPPGLLPDQLKAIGANDPWCGPNTLPIQNAESNDSRICIDENNLVLNGTHIVALMRTDPYLLQTTGNPSIFLTYQQPAKLPECIENKEAMRKGMQEDLALLLGAGAAQYTIEIHVDGRNLQHPCDDPIVVG